VQQVHREGPTCTDHANVLPYGVSSVHTTRNGSPSRFRFNGSSGAVHRTAFHNPMTCGVLATPPSHMASTQGRSQRARAAVKVLV
jgi:hypothetical protein